MKKDDDEKKTTDDEALGALDLELGDETDPATWRGPEGLGDETQKEKNDAEAR